MCRHRSARKTMWKFWLRVGMAINNSIPFLNAPPPHSRLQWHFMIFYRILRDSKRKTQHRQRGVGWGGLVFWGFPKNATQISILKIHLVIGRLGGRRGSRCFHEFFFRNSDKNPYLESWLSTCEHWIAICKGAIEALNTSLNSSLPLTGDSPFFVLRTMDIN